MTMRSKLSQYYLETSPWSPGMNGENVGILTSVHYILIRWFIAKETCKSPTKPEIGMCNIVSSKCSM